MVVSLRKWIERLKVLLLFIILTLFMFHFFQWLYDWLEPIGREKLPAGQAVKVISFQERLKLFYWYGE